MELSGESSSRWRIVFYVQTDGKSPIREWLEHLPQKQRDKVHAVLLLLGSEGPNLRRPYADMVVPPLRELRVKSMGNELRLLYFFNETGTAVMLHGFAKKTNAIPEREITTSQGRMKDLLRRVKSGEVEL
jgi:phage-related protein